MTQERRDFLLLHFLVLIWGFTAVIGVLITLPSVELVFYRTLIAALGLAVVVFWKRAPFRLPGRRDFLLTLGNGALIGAHWILFFLAARISNVSVCLVGIATCSLWTSILEPISYKRPVKSFEVLLGLVGLVGIVVVFNFEGEHFLGLFVAILSALLAAIFTVINGKLTKKHNPYTLTFYEMCGACSAILLFFPLYSSFTEAGKLNLSPTSSDVVYLLVLGLVCTVFTYTESVKLMRRLSAFSINLTVNLEPVYGIAMAFLFFGEEEKMEWGFYFGGLLVLTSVLLYPLFNRRYRRKALDTDILR